jgi:hypothetical protein
MSSVAPLEEPPKLVILYSTQYRQWEKACENHIELMRHIAGSEHNCLIGIHYWNHNTISLTNILDAPPAMEPPAQIRALKYKYSHSDQVIEYPRYKLLESIIKSTKIALEHAKELYRELYNKEMPEDQLIVRMRPDAMINDVPNFPKELADPMPYLSLWNNAHRPNVGNAYEAGDTIALTTRRAMEALTQVNLADLEYILRPTEIPNYPLSNEQNLYVLLTHLNVKIIQCYSLKIGVFRPSGPDQFTL